ncbi:MAG: hypothetical protein H7Z14_01760 [Anaerolineae bacterium]|nr:hypothetical protein [Phycisphaerae bacterium]
MDRALRTPATEAEAVAVINKIYTQIAPIIFAMFYRNVRKEDLADAIQSTALIVWSYYKGGKLKLSDNEGEVFQYLKSIAFHSVCRMLYKSKRRREKESRARESAITLAPDSAAECAERDQLEHDRRAFATLASQFDPGEIQLLFDRESGMTFAKMAQSRQITTQAIAGRYYSVMAKFRRLAAML